MTPTKVQVESCSIWQLLTLDRIKIDIITKSCGESYNKGRIAWKEQMYKFVTGIADILIDYTVTDIRVDYHFIYCGTLEKLTYLHQS